MTEDRNSSPENMLRWLIADSRKRLTENQAALLDVGEIYPLPKPKAGEPPHGQTENWSFGKLTPSQVDLSIALQVLGEASAQLDKAEAAMDSGNLPAAIYWAVFGRDTINSALARWRSGGAITMWRYVQASRKKQSVRAGKDRVSKPTKQQLDEFKSAHVARYGQEWGWRNKAVQHFGISMKTLGGVLKK